MPIFKPTADEWKTLKEVAFRGAELNDRPIKSPAGVQLELRTNANTVDRDKDIGDGLNMAIATNDWPECNDLDLDDKGTCYTDTFRKGVELTPDGRGMFDFYIYNRYDRDNGDLAGNVLMRVIDGKMAAIWIEGGRAASWTPETGVVNRDANGRA